MLPLGRRHAAIDFTDAAQLRARARSYRRQAGHAGDPVIHAELLRLADVYERLAANAENGRPDWPHPTAAP